MNDRPNPRGPVKMPASAAPARRASWRIGKRDLGMLVLSNIVILVSGGISFLWQLYQIYVVAKTTPATTAPAPWLVVLGMHVPHGVIGRDFALRLEKVRTLHAKNPSSRIVVLGGRTGADGRTEANIGAEYLRTRGIPNTCVMLEDKSRNTVENLRQAQDILGTSLPDRVVLISSRYHLARTQVVAKSLGIPHTLCAAEERLYLNVPILLRFLQEAYYLHWIVIGRAWTWLVNKVSRGAP